MLRLIRGGAWRTPCIKIRYFRSAMLCIKIGYRVYNVLRLRECIKGIPMVRFQCDGERKKNVFFFGFCVEMFFFRKIFGARYLIGNN